MRITICVGGRFQAFMLAQVLEQLGYLNRIITTVPKFLLKDEKINQQKIKVIIKPSQIINRLFGLDLPTRLKEIEAKYFSFVSSFLLNNPNIVYGFAGDSLEIGEKIKKEGGMFILDRTCPHVCFQEQLVKEESERLQVKYRGHTHDWINRCLEEYDIADKIVVPSNYTFKSFIDNGIPKDKIVKIPLPGKIDILSPEEIDRKRSKDNTFRVTFLGGNLIRKGLLYLLKAWDNLRLKNAELILRTSEKEIRKSPVIAKYLDKLENVKILPRYFKDIRDFYLLGDVFCLPSIDDGFGMAAVEAMAMRLPVIVTKNVGASEYIKDGEHGFVVPIRSPEAIGEKIEEFYCRRPFAKECGNHAYSYVKENLNLDTYREKIRIFFESL